MRLSILNYGTGAEVSVPNHAKKEDDALISIAREVAEKRDFGRGCLLVSQVMHIGLMNLNYREYQSKGMDIAVQSFFDPLFTPFLMHHDNGSQPDLLSVGTNLFAKYVNKKVETSTGVASGYVKVATFVGDGTMVGSTKAVDALQARQLLGLSIGARVSNDDYICSICNNSLYSDECDHYLGKTYDDQLCYAKVYNPRFREYSAVYTPADVNAVIRRIDIGDSEQYSMEEHVLDHCHASTSVTIYDVHGSVYPSAAVGDGTRDQTEDAPMNGTDDTTKNCVTKAIQELQHLLDKDHPDTSDVAAQLLSENTALKAEIESLNSRVKYNEKVIDVLTSALSSFLGSRESASGSDDDTDADNGNGDSDNGDVTPDNRGSDNSNEDSSPEDGEEQLQNGESGNQDPGSHDVPDEESSPDSTEDGSDAGESESSSSGEASRDVQESEKSYLQLLHARRNKGFGILSTNSTSGVSRVRRPFTPKHSTR